MASYYHNNSRSYSSMNFQSPPLFDNNNHNNSNSVEYNNANNFAGNYPYQMMPPPPPHPPQFCRCCEQMTMKHLGQNIVEVSRRCEHCHGYVEEQQPRFHLAPRQKTPDPDRKVVITAVVPEKALKGGVTLHFETPKSGVRPPFAARLQHRPTAPTPQPHLVTPYPCYGPPMALVGDETERYCYGGGEIVKPSLSFGGEKVQPQPPPGMQEFMEQYRRRMIAQSTNGMLRSQSQQLFNRNRDSRPQELPQSDIALQNCRRWFH